MKLTKKRTKIKDDKKINKYYFLGLHYLTKEKSFYERKTKIFNLCISHHVKKNKNISNQLDVKKLLDTYPKERFTKKIDIIIPVYNGYEYLDNLFESIHKNTDLAYHLFIVNDCSSDIKVKPLLEKWQNVFQNDMTLINNSNNLGFVKSVNKALKLTKNHVVLINTDVILPFGWASRLMYPIFIDNKVASVTPFSNAATIFSIPEINKNNDFSGNLEDVNSSLKKLNIPYHELQFPTGVGFCMAMNRNALKKIGFLDEIYDKGYCEENDWCQRAIKNGYYNTIAGNLFVWHKHGGSFESAEKKQLIQYNHKILLKRYPDYDNNVQEIIQDNAFISLRFISELFYLSAQNKTQVWFDHSWGGGTETYTFNKFSELKNDLLCVRIQNDNTDFLKISYYYKDITNSLIVHTKDTLSILSQLSIEDIVVNNLASYQNILQMLEDIAKLKKQTNAHVSFRGHDLQCICPSITMMNEQHIWCNCSSFKQCDMCFKKIQNTLPIKINSINAWHEKWTDFLKNTVDEIIVFSQSTFNLYAKYYPETTSKMMIIPHAVPSMPKINIPEHKGINIAVLGAIGISKGFLLLKEINNFINNYPNVNISVIGYTYEKLSNIHQTGKYDPKDLADIMIKNKIDIVFIPSVWPETFSYTTAEAMSMGLPIACFNIGAPAERVANYNKGLVIDKIDARYALEKIIQFIGEK